MDSVTVVLSIGSLRGHVSETNCGRTYFRFLGVPYATPPIGPLRFKPPVPVKPWMGILEAREFGNQCVQFDMVSQQLVGDEDCLYLNIYTPQLPGPKNFVPLPVMFWIHGGAFSKGNGSSELYGPDYLIRHDVIFVTINYRLGPLGFLSTEDNVVPGNMGLKDQVLALKWVKEHIKHFGGDPNNVTIFGESAGGASVHYLMLSPLARGLFQKAIIQSGSAFCPWAFTQKARERAFRLGSVLGCETSDSQELGAFLSKISAYDLIKKANKALSKEEQRQNLHQPFVPTIEVIHNKDNFLPSHPLTLAHCELGTTNVPCILGTTSHEGYLLMNDVWEDLSLLEKHFLSTLPSVANYERNKETVTQKVRKFYFNNREVSKEMLSSYIDFRTDLLFNFGVHMVAQIRAMNLKPTYRYVFSYSGELNIVKKFSGASHMPGACHGDELGYLFKTDIYDGESDSSKDADVRNKMTHMWTNFAKTGSPTPLQNAGIPLQWPNYTIRDPWSLVIDTDLKLHKDLFKERMSFMEELSHWPISKL